MGLRDEIGRIIKQDGLDKAWKWAKGHPNRWKALREYSQARVKELDDRADKQQNIRERAMDDLHRLADRIAEELEALKRLRNELDKAQRVGNKQRINAIKKKISDSDRAVERLRHEANSDRIKKARALRAEKELEDAEKGWHRRRVIYQNQYQKAKERADKGGSVKWEPWMANGYDANVSQMVKDILAVGVVKFDLNVTSMRRNYVPPGGSTTSYHLRGQAGDIAGPKMAAFQSWVYNAYKGNSRLLELFGPQNGVNLKYGNPLYLAEGTGLENLHDTHVHVAAA